MRPRKSNPLGLEPRMRFSHGAFYYHHKDGRWERLGTDLADAKKKAQHLNGKLSRYGSMAWYFDEFLVWCDQRVKADRLAPRTLHDYRDASKTLKIFWGNLTPAEVRPDHVQQFLDLGVTCGRSMRANREKAAWSAAMSWIRTRRPEGGILVNPCFGVRRNAEKKRDVYVDHRSYQAVYARATPMAKAYAELVYRTLQRPSDVLALYRANLKRVGDKTILQFTQSKTGAKMEIEIDAHLESVLAKIKRDVVGIPLLHSRLNTGYTETGIGSMWRRWCVAAKAAGEIEETFGVMDLRAKGATDMYLAGEPLERISELMGHESITTTERYIKRRLRYVVLPNQTKMAV